MAESSITMCTKLFDHLLQDSSECSQRKQHTHIPKQDGSSGGRCNAAPHMRHRFEVILMDWKEANELSEVTVRNCKVADIVCA